MVFHIHTAEDTCILLVFPPKRTLLLQTGKH